MLLAQPSLAASPALDLRAGLGLASAASFSLGGHLLALGLLGGLPARILLGHGLDALLAHP